MPAVPGVGFQQAASPAVPNHLPVPVIHPGVPNLGTRYHTLSTLSPAEREHLRQVEAWRLADRFCSDSIRRFGADEHGMKLILKQVARQQLQPTFNVAVRNLALQQGLLVRDAGEVVDQELGGNAITRFFKKAPRQACHDYLDLGRNTHASTHWEYRRYGMYRSGSDFVGLIKRHPAVSLSVIAAVSYLGNRFPFIGAASGIALMAWGGIVSAVSEYKASKLPYMNGRKAALYEKSGENLAAILLTMPGYHGIAEGMKGGVAQIKKTANLPEHADSVFKYFNALWDATKLDKDSVSYRNWSQGRAENAKTKEQLDLEERQQSGWMNAANRALFVAGLFDNVLLPFNWLADKLEDKD